MNPMWSTARQVLRWQRAVRAAALTSVWPTRLCVGQDTALRGRAALWTLVALALVWSALLLTTHSASAKYQIYVPAIAATGPGGSGSTPEGCGLNAEEAAVAQLMLNHNEQKRAKPVCNPILAQVARARARDMALRDYFSHTNPDGEGPNLLARRAGYPLPTWYSSARDSNNIESIGGGFSTAANAWQGWLNSSAHRAHVLGTHSFYAAQEAYAVGYYYNPDSRLKHYWVFLSAPVAE